MNLLDLIRRPHAFFEALAKLPPVPWRYAWLPVLAGIVAGISGVLLSRAILDVQTLMVYSVSGLHIPVWVLWAGTVVFSAALSLVSWLILWGMGQLGAGRDARGGEVYGASFLAPLLWSVVLGGLALLLPPQVSVAAPELGTLKGQALVLAIQKYTDLVTAQYAQSPVVKFGNIMGYAIYLVQFWLAYIGFRVVVGDAGRAWRGVLYPGLLFLALGAAALLIAGATTALSGGLV